MKKLKGYGILLIVTITVTASGLLTIIPYANASKQCLLSYKALCSFTPISTVICFVVAGALCKIRKNIFTVQYE